MSLPARTRSVIAAVPGMPAGIDTRAPRRKVICGDPMLGTYRGDR
jgi:hypothetical protein